MAKNNIIELHGFGREIGRVGYDENRKASFFQFNPAFLKEDNFSNMFPMVLRRMEQVQVFYKYNNSSFKGLPPPVADSLPDMFGNLIFKTWLENTNKNFEQISVLEQLCYVGRRGMGALEFLPAKKIPAGSTIDLEEIVEIIRLVLENKTNAKGKSLDTESLLNIFKIGSSAGGARPKILVSRNKKTGDIIPGDLEQSAEFDHYLIKLGLEAKEGYSREIIEYIYFLLCSEAGINMMPSELVDQKHFATLRFDRINGQKKHVLTACGISGMNFEDPIVSSYENLFELAEHLKLTPIEIEQLFRRMVFNVVFCNHDDHLKNHAFIYNEIENKWNLSPAYDITFSLNPLVNFTRTSRALSINGKRTDITQVDMKTVAEKFTIRKAGSIIDEIQQLTGRWTSLASEYNIPKKIASEIQKKFSQK